MESQQILRKNSDASFKDMYLMEVVLYSCVCKTVFSTKKWGSDRHKRAYKENICTPGKLCALPRAFLAHHHVLCESIADFLRPKTTGEDSIFVNRLQ